MTSIRATLLPFTVCLVERQPVEFSEYEAAEWVQALLAQPDLMASLFDDLSFGEPEAATAKKKKQ